MNLLDDLSSDSSPPPPVGPLNTHLQLAQRFYTEQPQQDDRVADDFFDTPLGDHGHPYGAFRPSFSAPYGFLNPYEQPGLYHGPGTVLVKMEPPAHLYPPQGWAPRFESHHAHPTPIGPATFMNFPYAYAHPLRTSTDVMGYSTTGSSSFDQYTLPPIDLLTKVKPEPRVPESNEDEEAQRRLDKESVQEESREWLCPVHNCGKAYRFKGDLKYHVKRKHPEHLDLPASISKARSAKVGKSFPCPVNSCNCGFKWARDLRRHIKAKHPSKEIDMSASGNDDMEADGEDESVEAEADLSSSSSSVKPQAKPQAKSSSTKKDTKSDEFVTLSIASFAGYSDANDSLLHLPNWLLATSCQERN